MIKMRNDKIDITSQNAQICQKTYETLMISTQMAELAG